MNDKQPFQAEIEQELAIQRERLKGYQILVDNPTHTNGWPRQQDEMRLRNCRMRIAQLEHELAPTPPVTVTAGG
jgi:hypothetical protein